MKNVELIRIKRINHSVRIVKHNRYCNFDHYKKEMRGCTCIDKSYGINYNFRLERYGKFVKDNSKSKKYSLLCFFENEYYYCYNLNEILDLGYEVQEIKFNGSSFRWKLKGVNGNYSSGNFFKVADVSA